MQCSILHKARRSVDPKLNILWVNRSCSFSQIHFWKIEILLYTTCFLFLCSLEKIRSSNVSQSSEPGAFRKRSTENLARWWCRGNRATLAGSSTCPASTGTPSLRSGPSVSSPLSSSSLRSSFLQQQKWQLWIKLSKQVSEKSMMKYFWRALKT